MTRRLPWIVLVVLLLGPGTNGHAASNLAEFPEPDKQAWDQAKRRRREERAEVIKIVEPHIQAAFLYDNIQHQPRVPEELLKTFRVVDFVEEFSDPATAYAVIVRDVDDPFRPAYLVAFRMGQVRKAYNKVAELSLGGSYSGEYELELIAAKHEKASFLHVARDEGAAFRFITHELYRLVRGTMKLVWQWSDGYQTGHAGPPAYIFTRVDFSEVSSDRNIITLYANYSGHGPEKHVFVWNPKSGMYSPKQ